MIDRLTSYAEMTDVIGRLPTLLRDARRARGLSLRAAGDEMGMSFNTVARIEQGVDCALSNAVAVLRWLDLTRPGDAAPAVPPPIADAQSAAAGERGEEA